MKQAEFQSDSAHTKRSGPGWFVWAIICFPLVYLLSSGPALGLATRRMLPSMAVHSFYAPLFGLANYCPPFSNAFYWYIFKCGWQPMLDASVPPRR